MVRNPGNVNSLGECGGFGREDGFAGDGPCSQLRKRMAWIPAFAMMTSGSEWAKSDVDMRMDPRLRGDDFWAGCWL